MRREAGGQRRDRQIDNGQRLGRAGMSLHDQIFHADEGRGHAGFEQRGVDAELVLGSGQQEFSSRIPSEMTTSRVWLATSGARLHFQLGGMGWDEDDT